MQINLEWNEKHFEIPISLSKEQNTEWEGIWIHYSVGR